MSTIEIIERLFDAVENILLSETLGIKPTEADYEALRRAYTDAERGR